MGAAWVPVLEDVDQKNGRRNENYVLGYERCREKTAQQVEEGKKGEDAWRMQAA